MAVRTGSVGQGMLAAVAWTVVWIGPLLAANPAPPVVQETQKAEAANRKVLDLIADAGELAALDAVLSRAREDLRRGRTVAAPKETY